MRGSKLTFAAWIALLYVNTAFAVIPNYDDPKTSLWPTLRASYASWFSDVFAYSLMGEAALKNGRLSATAGWKIGREQRLKVSGEYLWQRMTIGFISGNSKEWVRQGAVGLDYQYDFIFPYSPSLDLNIFVTHASDMSLSTVTATYLSNGIPTTLVDDRHIYGTDSYGIAPGVVINPWEGLVTTFTLNYDNVNYETCCSGTRVIAAGFGGTAHLKQRVGEMVTVDLLAGIRKPFNNYQAGINWDLCYKGRWTVGLFGAYTYGKEGFVTSYNAGINLNYFDDHISKDLPNYKDDLPNTFVKKNGPVDQRVLNWVNDPAIYMPEVEFIS